MANEWSTLLTSSSRVWPGCSASCFSACPRSCTDQRFRADASRLGNESGDHRLGRTSGLATIYSTCQLVLDLGNVTNKVYKLIVLGLMESSQRLQFCL